MEYILYMYGTQYITVLTPLSCPKGGKSISRFLAEGEKSIFQIFTVIRGFRFEGPESHLPHKLCATLPQPSPLPPARFCHC